MSMRCAVSGLALALGGCLLVLLIWLSWMAGNDLRLYEHHAAEAVDVCSGRWLVYAKLPVNGGQRSVWVLYMTG